MKKAFTLIELLVVILLIALIISLVSPAGYRLYEGVQRYIQKKEEADRIAGLKFEAFILQKENREYNISILGANYNMVNSEQSTEDRLINDSK